MPFRRFDLFLKWKFRSKRHGKTPLWTTFDFRPGKLKRNLLYISNTNFTSRQKLPKNECIANAIAFVYVHMYICVLCILFILRLDNESASFKGFCYYDSVGASLIYLTSHSVSTCIVYMSICVWVCICFHTYVLCMMCMCMLIIPAKWRRSGLLYGFIQMFVCIVYNVCMYVRHTCKMTAERTFLSSFCIRRIMRPRCTFWILRAAISSSVYVCIYVYMTCVSVHAYDMFYACMCIRERQNHQIKLCMYVYVYTAAAETCTNTNPQNTHQPFRCFSIFNCLVNLYVLRPLKIRCIVTTAFS